MSAYQRTLPARGPCNRCRGFAGSQGSASAVDGGMGTVREALAELTRVVPAGTVPAASPASTAG
eukprot:7218212-Pyramimonas_sp.AAC.1